MADTADIVVVGAGIIGMSIALQLARRTRARIVVVDKGLGPGEGSTGASSAVCRHRYTRTETTTLARDGIFAYRHWPEFLELRDPVARFHNHGVLWFGGLDSEWPDREAQRLHSLGIRAAVLDDRALAARFPALSACVEPPDIASGAPHACRGGGRHLFEPDGGYVDPVDALQDLIAAARARGVEVRFRAKVAGIPVEHGAAKGVVLADGTRLASDLLVNAAGPWCNAVFALAGLPCPWPLQPTRIQMAVVDRASDILGDIPVCADPTGGIYFRTQNRGQQLIVGSVREEDEQEQVADPDDYPAYADDDFVRTKLYLLQHRIPTGARPSGVRGYSGLYTMNRSDVHPVVGATPLRGFYVANGFSGHGFKLAPAIGSLIAREITGQTIGFDTSVDRRFLAFDRSPIALPSKNVLA